MAREQQPVVRPPIKVPPVILPPVGHRRVVPLPLQPVARPPIKAPPVILPPVGRRRVVPPLIIAPVQARVGPTRYLYVPGLARDELMVPCADKQAFITRVASTFGFRKKWIRYGEVMDNEFRHDEFMTGAVTALCETKGAIPVNCGRALRWVAVRGSQAPSKVFQLLGMPQQNLLAVNAGNKPKAPKGLQFGNQHWEICLAAEYIAQTKGKVVPPSDQNRAQPNEAKALAGLQ